MIFAGFFECFEGIWFSDIRFGTYTKDLLAERIALFINGTGFGTNKQASCLQKVEADLDLLCDVGGEVDADSDEVAVSVSSNLSWGGIVSGDRRHIDELDFDVFESYHTGDGGGGSEREVGDVDFSVGKSGEDRAFSAVRGAEESDLSIAASWDIKDIYLFTLFFCRRFF